MLERSNSCGQALVLGIAMLFAATLGIFWLFSVGQVTSTKQRLTNAADAAAYSAALWRARIFNYHAYSNRAIVAQEVAIAQAATLVSWAKYFETTMENLSKIPFPPTQAIFNALAEVAEGNSTLVQGAATVEVGARTGYKIALEQSQRLLEEFSRSGITLGAIAAEVARANDPGFFAFVANPSVANIARRYTGDDRERLKEVVLASLDSFTKDRGNDLPLPIAPPACPRLDSIPHLRKRGGTVLAPGLDRWEAVDTISIHESSFRRFRCRTSEAVPVGYGAAEVASPVAEEGRIVADPGGSASTNPQATDLAGDDIVALSAYDGLASTHELDYGSLEGDDRLFPLPKLLVIACARNAAVRTANRLDIGVGRLRLREDMAGGRLWAAASARLYFRRPPGDGRDDEYASLFNPYWQVRLAPLEEQERVRAEAAIGSGACG